MAGGRGREEVGGGGKWGGRMNLGVAWGSEEGGKGWGRRSGEGKEKRRRRRTAVWRGERGGKRGREEDEPKGGKR